MTTLLGKTCELPAFAVLENNVCSTRALTRLTAQQLLQIDWILQWIAPRLNSAVQSFAASTVCIPQNGHACISTADQLSVPAAQSSQLETTKPALAFIATFYSTAQQQAQSNF